MSAVMEQTAVLEVRDLVKHYPIKGGLFAPPKAVHALDGGRAKLVNCTSQTTSTGDWIAEPGGTFEGEANVPPLMPPPQSQLVKTKGL